MPSLLITADELGKNPQRSHGIFITAEQGVVTGVGLVANGSDSDTAARHAAERNVPTGLHLVLTDGMPVGRATDRHTLLTTDGCFFDAASLERSLNEGMIEPVHVEREVRCQLEWFLSVRGQPTHLSSRQHFHVHPFLAAIIAPLMDRYGIDYVRIPSEPATPFGYEIDDRSQQRIKHLSSRAEHARSIYAAHGIGSTAYFRGLAYHGNATMRTMRHTLARLPEGTVEWMVHPGSAHPHGDAEDADPQRLTELHILTNPDTLAAIQERERPLASFAENIG